MMMMKMGMTKRLGAATRVVLAVMSISVLCAAQAVVSGTPTAASSAATAGTPAPVPAALTADAGKPPVTGPQFNKRTPRYHIEAGDTFDLTFELSPEFNQLGVAVQPDGFVTLRSVGEVKVAGETVPELTETLRQAYSKILNNPLISVVLKEFEKPYFIADGQVSKPGKYEMHGTMTLTQAIAVAGGFQSSAKHSQVVLFRRIDDQWTEAQLINVKKMENSRNLKEDPVLHPGDMLFVPKNTLSKIDRVIPNLSMGSYLPLAIP
jgi:polysaccharide export outer membrane protein